jgi:putative sterol carrier protein
MSLSSRQKRTVSPSFSTPCRLTIGGVRWPLVRYQFDLRAESARRYDLTVEGGKIRLEPAGNVPANVTLHCNPATFALMMYKRLTLAPAVASGRLTVAGDEALAAALDQWLHQP